MPHFKIKVDYPTTEVDLGQSQIHAFPVVHGNSHRWSLLVDQNVREICLKEAAFRAGLSETQTARYVRRLRIGYRRFGSGRWVVFADQLEKLLIGGQTANQVGADD